MNRRIGVLSVLGCVCLLNSVQIGGADEIKTANAAQAAAQSIKVPRSLFDNPKINVGSMSSDQLTAELARTIAALVGSVAKLSLTVVSQIDPKVFDPKKIDLIEQYFFAYNHLLETIKVLFADQCIKTKGTQQCAKDANGKFIYRLQYKQNCMKGKGASKDICKALGCETKALCSQSLMRDLYGYVGKDGIKHKGLVREMLKIMFTGYKIGGKSYSSIFSILAQLTGLSSQIELQVITIVKSVNRVLKLSSQMTYKEPEKDVLAIIEQQKADAEKARLEKEKKAKEKIEKQAAEQQAASSTTTEGE
ncbi:MAG: hypothetical protein UU47_C0018G0009 [candidate division TM6 bacterium GW2011_GWE2_41_16]|nr:MAG: hypothetical protein UU47_C0018G0009 [candidate division TM6 bacterium GW2011_GWE2_41_16]